MLLRRAVLVPQRYRYSEILSDCGGDPGRSIDSLIYPFKSVFFLNPLVSQPSVFNAKSTEKFQEEYSKHSYTFHQDSPVVNILPCFTLSL